MKARIPDYEDNSSTETYQWTACDRQLGTVGRAPGDPEFDGIVFYQGMLKARCLADDGGKLLSAKEKAIFGYTLAAAHANPQGHGAVLREHIPPEIARMPGETPLSLVINLCIDGIHGYEPRWVLTKADGKIVGGRLDPSQTQRQEQRIERQRRVHIHQAPDLFIDHGPINARVEAEPSQVRIHQPRPLTLFGWPVRR
jgi:hypothetical protein